MAGGRFWNRQRPLTLAAGTAVHAPKPPFLVGTRIGRVCVGLGRLVANSTNDRYRCNLLLFSALVRLSEGSGDSYETTQVHDASVGPLRSRRVPLKMQEHRIGNQVKLAG